MLDQVRAATTPRHKDEDRRSMFSTPSLDINDAPQLLGLSRLDDVPRSLHATVEDLLADLLQTGTRYYLDRLPTGYRLYERPRPTGGTKMVRHMVNLIKDYVV